MHVKDWVRNSVSVIVKNILLLLYTIFNTLQPWSCSFFSTSPCSTQKPSLQRENVTCHIQNNPPDGGMQNVNAVYSTLWGIEAEQPEYMNMAFNKCKNQKVSPERPPLPTENLHTINQNSQERMHITEQMWQRTVHVLLAATVYNPYLVFFFLFDSTIPWFQWKSLLFYLLTLCHVLAVCYR